MLIYIANVLQKQYLKYNQSYKYNNFNYKKIEKNLSLSPNIYQQMRPQQKLITQVQQFLLQKHNIKIILPRMHNLMDSKINLKITPVLISTMDYNPQKIQSSQNRYKIIMNYIQSLLASSNLDVNSIDSFMNIFFKIINTDIDILQKNQVIRSNSFRVKEKLIFRIQEITKKTNILKTAIDKIHDKRDIISFIAIDIKNYLMSMKLITEQHQNVKAVEIYTPIKIDPIYQNQHSSQQDYHDHYQPMLQVLIRLRSNMVNLHSTVKNCNRIQIPLKSVNLLANCKNLLTQLQPFLITNKCAYNRLLFHVVTQQNQSMKLISRFYKNYLTFIKQLIYNVYKCVYLGHLFKQNYKQFQSQIEQNYHKILSLIKQINININPTPIQKQINFYSQKLQYINKKIKQIQKIIFFGKSNVMQQYIQQKICKKLLLLIKNKQKVIQLQQIINYAKQYMHGVRKIQEQIMILEKNKVYIGKYVDIFTNNQNKQNNNNNDYSENNISKRQVYEGYFKTGFILIQNHNINIAVISELFKKFENNCKAQQLRRQYFPQFQDMIKLLKEEYLALQTLLLNSYNHLLLEQEEKQAKALAFSNKCIQDVVSYLVEEDQDEEAEEGGVKAGMGGQIFNQDSHSNRVKQLLGYVVKAQFMISNIKPTQSSKNQLKHKNPPKKIQKQKLKQNSKKLQRQKKYLQWLLILFEGSVDEGILSTIIDKMDFIIQNQQSIQKNINKVKQLLTELTKYNRELRKLIKQIQLLKNKNQVQQNQKLQKQKQKQKQKDKDEQSERNKNRKKQKQKQTKIQNFILLKILKIIKQRLILYQFIQNLYSECLIIYTDCKLPKQKQLQNYNIQTSGITLFDKNLYNYTLLCYHCLNKISILSKQLNDSNLGNKSKNYLNDDILQPYINRFNNFIKYDEKQMLNLMLRLERAIDIQKQYKNKFKKWENSGDQLIKQKDKNLCFGKWKEISEEFVQMEQEIQRIMELSDKNFVVLNIDALKKIHNQCEQYIDVAKQIVKVQQFSQLVVAKTYKNDKITQILGQIHKSVIKN